MTNQEILELSVERCNLFYKTLEKCSNLLIQIKNQIFHPENKKSLDEKKNLWNYYFLKLLKTLRDIAQGNIALKQKVSYLHENGILA